MPLNITLVLESIKGAHTFQHPTTRKVYIYIYTHTAIMDFFYEILEQKLPLNTPKRFPRRLHMCSHRLKFFQWVLQAFIPDWRHNFEKRSPHASSCSIDQRAYPTHVYEIPCSSATAIFCSYDQIYHFLLLPSMDFFLTI